ncbi:helix-turn-helix transcriptional regulator [Butyrivibrio sp. NC2002]|uniref:helix-turn-helix transcriptional regulator n=1 Tax=Butyrivibrio sp. NC2002 TaxID=1410610 RepID=UPI00068F07E4|nr:helix-turn-helix transcriptional regulator [Butyrivibrio sp. NC2002]
MNIPSYIAEIKRKIKQCRIKLEMTQKELADKSGVSLRSIQRFENGEEISFANFIKIIYAVGLIDNVNDAIPDMEKGSSVLLERERHAEKKRVRKKKNGNHGLEDSVEYTLIDQVMDKNRLL